MFYYILQVMLDEEQSVVIGCYDSLEELKYNAQTHLDHNPMFFDKHYFYDIKLLNGRAKWTNEQQSVWN